MPALCPATALTLEINSRGKHTLPGTGQAYWVLSIHACIQITEFSADYSNTDGVLLELAQKQSTCTTTEINVISKVLNNNEPG